MAQNEESLANLQEAFRGCLDPEVVDLILAESNYIVEDALEKLFAISKSVSSSDFNANSENRSTKQDGTVNTTCNTPRTNESNTFRGNKKKGHKTFSLRDDQSDSSLAPLPKEDKCGSFKVTEREMSCNSHEQLSNSAEAMDEVKDSSLFVHNHQKTNSTSGSSGGQSGIEVADQASLPNELPPWPDFNQGYMHQFQSFPGQPHGYQRLPTPSNFQVQRFTGDAGYFHYTPQYHYQKMGPYHPRSSFYVVPAGIRYPPVGLHPRKGAPQIGAHFKKNKSQPHFGMQKAFSKHQAEREEHFLPLGKVLVILRGLPGSGKTTLAQKMKGDGSILSTDGFFMRNGKYQYEQTDLSEAHEWNQKRAKDCMQRGVSPIIIDNTNTQAWEMRPYAAMAQRFGYKVIIKEPETPWKWNTKELLKRNQHDVTLSAIQNMKERYEKNLTVEAILGKNWKGNPKNETCNSSEQKNDKDSRNSVVTAQNQSGNQANKQGKISGTSANPSSISQLSDQGSIHSKGKCQDEKSLRSHGSRSPIQDIDFSLTEALPDAQSSKSNENLNKGSAEVDFDEAQLPKPQRTPKKRERASRLLGMEQTSQEVRGDADKVLDSIDTQNILISGAMNENDEKVEQQTHHSSNQEEQEINTKEQIAACDPSEDNSLTSYKKDTGNSGSLLQTNDEPKTDEINESGFESFVAKETANDKDATTNDCVQPLSNTENTSGSWNTLENIATEKEPSHENFKNDLSESEPSGFQFLNTCFPDMDIQILVDVLAQNQGDVTKAVESILCHEDNIASGVESPKQDMSDMEIKSALVVPDPDLRPHTSPQVQEARASLHSSNKTFQMTLEPAVAIHLLELFGPIDNVSLEGDFSSDDLIINVDSEFSKLLYNQWRRTIQNNSKEKFFYTERQPPVERTRKKRDSLDHRKTADLRQIMSEQMAVEQSRQKQEQYTEESMAVVLKRQKLYAMFPGVDPSALEELFLANRYELQSTISMVETSCNLQAKLSEFQVEQSKELARPYDDGLREVKTEFQEFQDPDYEDFRAEANTHYKLRDECFRKAAFAFSKKQGQLAQFYASQGHMHTEKIRQANRRAAAKILEHKNSTMDQHCLDLHGLHVDEALSALEEKLLFSESRYLSVITGQGIHSKQGKAKIKPAVLEYLQRNNYRFEELQPGLLRVSVNR